MAARFCCTTSAVSLCMPYCAVESRLQEKPSASPALASSALAWAGSKRKVLLALSE